MLKTECHNVKGQQSIQSLQSSSGGQIFN